ncbi:MAG TPA: NADPH-dependent FMN reductase [Steroidobacteraceae bacterium]|nr:NADPH-dependent FMN reductase [Steroidobacteraceae bacterium]
MRVKILGVCGSLREASTNTRLLHAALRCLPAGVKMHLTSCIGRLPLFNPDLQNAHIAVVDEWVEEVKAADGLLISTPEYARGYPGALKNALDWLVNTDAYVNKPFMLLKCSARSNVAHETLTVVLETMSGIHIAGASTTVPLLGTGLTVEQILENPEFAERIRAALSKFASELERTREQ